jgi:hypothetical protein
MLTWWVKTFFSCSATVQIGPNSLFVQIYRSHTHTQHDFIWASDQSIAGAATYTAHSKHKWRTSMPSAGLESAIPAIKLLQIYALPARLPRLSVRTHYYIQNHRIFISCYLSRLVCKYTLRKARVSSINGMYNKITTQNSPTYLDIKTLRHDIHNAKSHAMKKCKSSSNSRIDNITYRIFCLPIFYLET